MARDAKSDKLKGEFAFIPGRWVERNISDMELDEPYILSVMHCEAPGCESSRLWVDQNGAPMLAGDMDASDLGRDMNAGDLMAGGFAVMRTWAMVGGEPKEGYVVDIRYSDTGMIPRIDTTKVPDDQEEYDGWLDFMQHTIPVAAVVIAKDEGVNMDPELKKKKRKDVSVIVEDYEVYGQPAFMPAVESLVAAVDKKVLKAERKVRIKEEKEKLAQKEAAAEIREREQQTVAAKVRAKIGAAAGFLSRFKQVPKP